MAIARTVLLSTSMILAGTFNAQAAGVTFEDRTFYSRVFSSQRHYRIWLPKEYDTGEQRYPVIYYFHGHSDRYTLERYDDGKDTVPKIGRFVSAHDAIVVTVDGYVKEHYTGFYGGSPWDVRIDGGDYDFGEYFQEMVAHIDSTYRTQTGRRYRATSGLSMGGFASLFLSARYPHLIGSASAFNPGPEFYLGAKGRRALWRPKDHVSNHQHTMVRLIRASGDYISQYHEETHAAYASAHDVDYEYRRDEYHRHWATSIGETFEFHMRAFANPELDVTPAVWSHANPYPKFDVWNYQIESSGEGRAITYLAGVRRAGLRVTTRRWAPDGPAVPKQRIQITTPPLYEANGNYSVIDLDLQTNRARRSELRADRQGRLTLSCDGGGHQLSVAGPGVPAHPPVLLPLTSQDLLRVLPQTDVSLPLKIYNPGPTEIRNLTVKASSEYPAVSWLGRAASVDSLASGEFVDLSDQFSVRFTAGDGYFARTRLDLDLAAEELAARRESIDVLVAPEVIPDPLAVEVLDGRTMTLPVFRQKGNQGGGGPVERTVTEGQGNGNGILETGEEATVWVQIAQGLDPFDKHNWYRCKVYADSQWLEEVADIQEQKQLEWTGAQERTSLIRLVGNGLLRERVPVILDNESWSYYFTPDIRFGKAPLYQAFQFHRHHLHRFEIPTEVRPEH